MMILEVNGYWWIMCSYDSDRSIFWLIGGIADTVPDAYNFIVIFNCTGLKEGLFGERKININGTV